VLVVLVEELQVLAHLAMLAAILCFLQLLLMVVAQVRLVVQVEMAVLAAGGKTVNQAGLEIHHQQHPRKVQMEAMALLMEAVLEVEQLLLVVTPLEIMVEMVVLEIHLLFRA
jgi:hypothetical protein